MTLEGILPVIPTPFIDGRFDERSFDRLCEHTLEHLDGYTLLGSTGEAPSLSTQERMEIVEAALARTPADKTVVVGVTHTTLSESVRLAVHAQEHGAAGVLCAAPFYFSNTSEGVLGYLTALDDVLSVELVLYDNPVATKTNLEAGAVVEWAKRLEHLNTVKLTDHSLEKISIWHDAGLKVMGGDDPIGFRYMAGGVDGVMMIAPALFPEPFRCVWDAIKRGEVERALEVFCAEILPVVHVFGIGDEIGTSKALLHAMDVFASDEVRLPLQRSSRERLNLLNAAWAVCQQGTRLRVDASDAAGARGATALAAET